MAKMYKDPLHPELGVIDEVDFCQMMHTVEKMSKEIDRLRNEVNMLHGWQGLLRLEADQIRVYANGHRHINLTKDEAALFKGHYIEAFVRLKEEA